MKKILFISCVCCFSFLASSQIQPGYYLPFQLAYSNQIVKDASIAPVSYSGSAGNLSSGFFKQSARWVHSLDVKFSSGLLYSDVSKDEASTVILLGGRMNYGTGIKVFQKKGYHLYAGLSSLNSFDFRSVTNYSNNSDNFQAAFGLGPYFNTQKSFQLFSQTFNLMYQLSIPAVAYVLRPGYIKPYFANDLGYQSFAGWSNYFQLDSKVSLQWLISKENYLCLNYQWEYFQLNRPNKIQLAQHYIGFSLLTHL